MAGLVKRHREAPGLVVALNSVATKKCFRSRSSGEFFHVYFSFRLD